MFKSRKTDNSMLFYPVDDTAKRKFTFAEKARAELYGIAKIAGQDMVFIGMRTFSPKTSETRVTVLFKPGRDLDAVTCLTIDDVAELFGGEDDAEERTAPDNYATLYINDGHAENSARPYYRGRMVVGGQRYEVSAWLKFNMITALPYYTATAVPEDEANRRREEAIARKEVAQRVAQRVIPAAAAEPPPAIDPDLPF